MEGKKIDDQFKPNNEVSPKEVSVFEVFPESETVPVESFGSRGMTVLVAGGIVNPFGPTLVVAHGAVIMW